MVMCYYDMHVCTYILSIYLFICSLSCFLTVFLSVCICFLSLPNFQHFLHFSLSFLLHILLWISFVKWFSLLKFEWKLKAEMSFDFLGLFNAELAQSMCSVNPYNLAVYDRLSSVHFESQMTQKWELTEDRHIWIMRLRALTVSVTNLSPIKRVSIEPGVQSLLTG